MPRLRAMVASFRHQAAMFLAEPQWLIPNSSPLSFCHGRAHAVPRTEPEACSTRSCRGYGHVGQRCSVRILDPVRPWGGRWIRLLGAQPAHLDNRRPDHLERLHRHSQRPLRAGGRDGHIPDPAGGGRPRAVHAGLRPDPAVAGGPGDAVQRRLRAHAFGPGADQRPGVPHLFSNRQAFPIFCCHWTHPLFYSMAPTWGIAP